MFGLAAYYSIDAYSQLCAHCAAFVKNISVLRKEKGHVEMDDSYVAKRSALFPLYCILCSKSKRAASQKLHGTSPQYAQRNRFDFDVDLAV